jgi:2-keto-3-deoxy-6-phosphogluconate aldolase
MIYKKDRNRVREALINSGVVVVINKKHVKNPQHLITTMWEVYQAGFVAETTFRIDPGILKEAMVELIKMREKTAADKPFILACGSIINPSELDDAINMGFEMIVAPGNVMGGHNESKEFIQITRQLNIFSAPAVLTPNELQYYIERSDGLEPDAIKIFPAGVYGASGLKALLAPFARERHNDRIIMPTGGVNNETGQKIKEAISGAGYTPVLGMSAPLALVEKENKPGDVETIRKSLRVFKEKMEV